VTARQEQTGFLRRFARDRRGMGAVEFALIAPVLIVLYISGSELSMFLTLNRKVQHATSTINDLITQTSSIDPAGIDGVYNAAKSIITPYKLTPLKILTNAVFIDNQGLAKVVWSYSNDKNLIVPKGRPFTVPASFGSLRSKQIVVVTTHYDYVPIIGSSVMSARDIGSTSYLHPRNGSEVKCDAC
jgi:Flp pilus assembly protein TadG